MSDLAAYPIFIEFLFIMFELIKFATAEHATDSAFVIGSIYNIMLELPVVAILALLVVS